MQSELITIEMDDLAWTLQCEISLVRGYTPTDRGNKDDGMIIDDVRVLDVIKVVEDRTCLLSRERRERGETWFDQRDVATDSAYWREYAQGLVFQNWDRMCRCINNQCSEVFV